MAKFRETLWFKKGELDAVAAQDPEGPGAADLLPIEDRYGDDGSVSNADTAAFGVRSGQTQSLDMLTQTRRVEVVEASAPPPDVIAHLKAGRLPVIAAIAASVLAMVAAVYVF
jgi:hypothetical protein